ncbi:MAG: fibronectin type III domain-containing protein [Gemmatimonadota bacterium]
MCLCTAIAGCDQVSVSPLAVSSIDIAPRSVEIAVGEVVQLTATPRAPDGSALGGTPLTWRSSDPDRATVDAAGRVTGIAPGAVAVTVTGAGVAGSAAISVGLPGQVSLGTSSLDFRGAEGGSDPTATLVAVDDGGGVTLTDLEVEIVYQSGASGWLDATLASATAPTTLRVQPRLAALGTGTYGARVSVRSRRSGSSSDLAVTLTVAPPGPDLRLSADSLVLRGRPLATGSVDVVNGGTGPLDGLSATPRYRAGGPTGWLSATLSGAVAPVTLNVTADGRTLTPGRYEAEVLVASSRPGVSSRLLQVVYVVDSLPPTLDVTPASVTLVGAQGQAAAPTSTVQVRNAGDGVLDGLGTSVSYGSGQPSGWLTARLSGTTAPTTLSLTAGLAGLSPGTYDASVEVRGSAANSPRFVAVRLTVQAPAATVPAAPSGLSASLSGTSAAQLSWVDNATTETGQELQRSADGGASWTTVATPAANATGHTDPGLAAATTFLYRVRACNAVGCSGFSNTASVTTPGGPTVPAAPTGLTVAPVSATEVDLRWTDASTNETRYEVERRTQGGAFTPVASLPPNTQVYRDSGLAAGEPHEWQVRACNAAGCSAWVGVGVTMPPVPPSNLVVTSATSSQVDLQWVDNSTNETLFLVQRLTAAGWQTLTQLPADSTTYADTSVAPLTVYFYRVAACATSWCTVSNAVTVLTP